MSTKKPYVVLARQYRPARFEELVGQEPIAAALRSGIEGGRLGHAFLFAGPRGVGKTSMARILAKCLNCLSSKGPTADPCGTCEACTAIARGTDVDAIEFDAASNRKVEEIQSLILDHVDYPPVRCRNRIYIVDEVQQLSAHAFDALLKTLEEPPPHVRFIFATTRGSDIPPTIHSRCLRFDFRRVPPDRLLEHLKEVCRKEGAKVPEETLRLVARSAQGGVRDALSMLDQVLALGGCSADEAAALVGIPPDQSFGAFLDAALAGDLPKGFAVVEDVWNRGWDLKEFAEGFIGYLRDHLVAAAGDDGALAWRYGPEARKAVEARTKLRPVGGWLELLDRAVVAVGTLRESGSSRLGLELLFTGLCPRTAQPSAAPVPVPVPVPSAAAPAPVRPAPVPPPPAAARAPAGPFEWARFLDALEEKRMSLAALLRTARPSSPEGNALTVRLGPDRTPFDLEKLGEPEKKVLVEQAAASVAGRPLQVRFELEGARPAPPPPQAAPPASAPPPANDPIVALAAKLLAGRVVKRPPPD